ncbi:MAG: hypothetical protein AB8B99_13140 [Phormidesmis sp.]
MKNLETNVQLSDDALTQMAGGQGNKVESSESGTETTKGFFKFKKKKFFHHHYHH